MRVLSSRMNALPLPASTRPDGVPTIRWPSQRHLIGRLVCGTCSSTVVVDDWPSAVIPLVDVACWICSRVTVELQADGLRERRPRTAEEVQPSKRRAPKPSAELPASSHPCADCPTIVQGHRERCRPCYLAVREAQALQTRIVMALSTRRWIPASELCEAFGITRDGLKNAVARARASGRQILHIPGQGYRLEATG